MISRRKIIVAGGLAAAGGPAAASAADLSVQQRNKDIIRQYFQRCWNEGDLDFAATIMVPDYDLHLAQGPGGYPTWRAGVASFRMAFPNVRFDNLALIAEGDLVAVRSVWSGTHAGEFMGVAPTGREIVARNADYYRLRDGKMFAHWDVPDFLTVLWQIGALPEAAMAKLPPDLMRKAWPADASRR